MGHYEEKIVNYHSNAQHGLALMQVVVLPWRYAAKMGTANLLTRFGKRGDYNERFSF